jgi:hypothetical protein
MVGKAIFRLAGRFSVSLYSARPMGFDISRSAYWGMGSNGEEEIHLRLLSPEEPP